MADVPNPSISTYSIETNHVKELLLINSPCMNLGIHKNIVYAAQLYFVFSNKPDVHSRLTVLAVNFDLASAAFHRCGNNTKVITDVTV